MEVAAVVNWDGHLTCVDSTQVTQNPRFQQLELTQVLNIALLSLT